MSLDWRGAFCPGLKCVENMECCGISVSTVDSQMCGVVLWRVCFYLFIYFACLVFWGVCVCVCVCVCVVTTGGCNRFSKGERHADKVWIIFDAPILGLVFFRSRQY